MRVGLPTSLFFKDDIEGSIRKLIDLNVDCVEIVSEVYHFSPGRIELPGGVKDLLESKGIESTVHSSFFDLNLGSPYPQVRNLSVEMARQSMDLCNFLNCKIVTLHPGHFYVLQHEQLWTKAKLLFEECLKECLSYARKLGVHIGLENIQVPYFFYSDLRDMKSFVQGLGDVGITLDLAHAYLLKKWMGIDSPESEISREIRELGESIDHVHLHDNEGIKDDHLSPGKGNIDFEPMIEALKEIGYDDHVIIEAHESENPASVAEESLRTVRDLFK